MKAAITFAMIAVGLALVGPADATDCVFDEALHSRITRHEGIRACVYHDQFGNPTIGVGHLLPKPVKPGLCWGIAKIAKALALDIERARGNAEHDLGSEAWARTPPLQQDVLTEMAFQIGGNGLMHFRRMLAAVRNGDFDLAAVELMDSKLAMQTPKRAMEMACLMRGE